MSSFGPQHLLSPLPRLLVLFGVGCNQVHHHHLVDWRVDQRVVGSTAWLMEPVVFLVRPHTSAVCTVTGQDECACVCWIEYLHFTFHCMCHTNSYEMDHIYKYTIKSMNINVNMIVIDDFCLTRAPLLPPEDSRRRFIFILLPSPRQSLGLYFEQCEMR